MNLPVEVRQCAARTSEENETKLGRQAKEMTIVGFQKTGYQLLNPKTMALEISGDIRCYENENFRMVRDRIRTNNTSNPIVISDKPKPVPKKIQTKKTTASGSNTPKKTPSEIIQHDHTYVCAVFCYASNKFRKTSRSLGEYLP